MQPETSQPATRRRETPAPAGFWSRWGEGIWITAYALFAVFLNMTELKGELLARVATNLLAPLVMLWNLGQRSIRDYGLDFRNVRAQVLWTFYAYLLILPTILGVSLRGDFQAFYEFPTPDARLFLYKMIVLYGTNYFIWEFLLRGFLLFGLAYHFGWWAVLIQELVMFPLAHLGKPPLEMLVAAYAGIVFSIAAFRSRSFLPAFFSHWALGVTLDTIIFVQRWGWGPLLGR